MASFRAADAATGAAKATTIARASMERYMGVLLCVTDPPFAG
jgi:hypothetical protein